MDAEMRNDVNGFRVPVFASLRRGEQGSGVRRAVGGNGRRFPLLILAVFVWSQSAFSAASPAPSPQSPAPTTRPSALAPRPSAPATQPSEDLTDVSKLMVRAGQRLYEGHPDEPAQAAQRHAIAILDRLIEQAKCQQQQQCKTCKACGGKGCRLCRQGMAKTNQQPASPAQQSTVNPGEERAGELHSSPTARPGEAWGNMRPEERDRILQSFGKDFPSQYRQLVEQYYKQLGKEK
jgi:hypothetical protein